MAAILAVFPGQAFQAFQALRVSQAVRAVRAVRAVLVPAVVVVAEVPALELVVPGAPVPAIWSLESP